MLCAGIYYRIANGRLVARIHGLEQDLHHISDVISQITEVQIKTFQKYSTGMEGLEERILELSVPSHDSIMPLEKRHQVLALARQGIALEDIVKRLKAPVGEAEVILNLQKYMTAESPRSLTSNGQVKNHA
jgi:predicted Ser/Thr protein kinase